MDQINASIEIKCFILVLTIFPMFISSLCFYCIKSPEINEKYLFKANSANHQERLTKFFTYIKKIISKRVFFAICNVFCTVICNGSYWVIVTAYFLLSFSIETPYKFLRHFNETSIQDLLTPILIDVSNIIGPIIIGLLLLLARSFNWLLYLICIIFAGLLTCFFQYIPIYVYAILFGLFTSVNYVILSGLLIDTVDLANLTLAYGLIRFIQGIATFFAIPAFTLIHTPGSYLIFYISGACLIVSGLPSLFFYKTRNIGFEPVPQIDMQMN